MQIPNTINEAVDQLAGLDRLVTATEWERAAIVWAFTSPGNPLSGTKRVDTDPVSFATFSGYGIHGLKRRDTVQTYWEAWQKAIDDGKAKAVKPGGQFSIPKMDWPPTGHTTGSFAKQLANKTPEAKADIVRELLDEPAVEEEVYREPERVDRAVSVDQRHIARDRRIVDPHIGADDTVHDSSPSYTRVQDGHKFLDALAHITDAAIVLGRVAEDLAGLELTDSQRTQIERRYDRLAAKLEMLRASTSSGSIDDELAAILRDAD